MLKHSSVINYHIEEIQQMENLTERTKNVCLKGSLDTMYKILAYFLKNGSFKKIRNCGDKTNVELIELAERYIKKYNITRDFLDMSKEAQLFEKFKFFCYSHFGIPSIETEQFKEQFFAKDFEFFKYILLIFKKVLNRREYFIFENNFGYFKDRSKMTLQSIGDNYGITRERVRQISQNIPDKLMDTLSIFSTDLDFIHNYFHYDLDVHKDYIFIDDRTANRINLKEKLNAAPKFYSLGFTVIFAENYETFQDGIKDYKNYYLINKQIFRSFDFPGFFETLESKYTDRIEKTYTIDFDEFVDPFFQTDDPKLIKKIKPICRKVADSEFGIKLTENKDLVFERNTLKKISEYIIEILEKYGRPMNLREINQVLETMTPKAPQNIESLRSSILSIPEIVAIGKTSTYSLEKWGGIKTGTIKELVKEYLDRYEEPRHISEVTEYVNQYRNTNNKNVLSNLKLDKTRTFIFFKKSYIGISSKDYTPVEEKFGKPKAS